MKLNSENVAPRMQPQGANPVAKIFRNPWRPYVPAAVAVGYEVQASADLLAGGAPSWGGNVPIPNPTLPAPSPPPAVGLVPARSVPGTFNPGGSTLLPRPNIQPTQPVGPTIASKPDGAWVEPVSSQPSPNPNRPALPNSGIASGLGAMVLRTTLIGAAIGFALSAVINIGVAIRQWVHARGTRRRAQAAMDVALVNLAAAQANVKSANSEAEVTRAQGALKTATKAVSAAQDAVLLSANAGPNWWHVAGRIIVDTAIAAATAAAATAMIGLLFGTVAMPGGAAGILIALVIGFATAGAVKKAVTPFLPAFMRRRDPSQDGATESQRASVSTADRSETKAQESLDRQLSMLEELLAIERQKGMEINRLRRNTNETDRLMSPFRTRAGSALTAMTAT